MLFFVLGLPGQHTNWCTEVLRSILEREGRATNIVHIDNIQSLAVELTKSESDNTVVLMHRLDRALLETLSEVRKTVLLVSSNPLRGFFHFRHFADFSDLEAARHVMSSCASIISLIQQGVGNFIDTENFLRTPEIGIRQIANAFGKNLGDADIAEIYAHTKGLLQSAYDDSDGGGFPLQLLKDQTKKDFVQAMEFSVIQYDRALKSGSLDRIAVVRDFFVTGDAPHRPVVEPIDVTGLARCLFFGPYVNLPVGSWAMNLALSFSEGCVGVPFKIEITAEADQHVEHLGTLTVQISTAGRHDFGMNFDTTNPKATIEVRIFNEKAVFDGHLSLGFADFKRRNRVHV
ncbi:hypothetical protein [Desulfosediminicola sp.]|uniref:hypothetical protein n=1 Tax=Desulfosediminicola sp. TaxID=2886825 RepID=UPI003AF24661